MVWVGCHKGTNYNPCPMAGGATRTKETTDMARRDRKRENKIETLTRKTQRMMKYAVAELDVDQLARELKGARR